MMEDYDGTDVADAAGERIGTVERSYVDDQGKVQFIEVKLRGLRAKHRLVPMDIIDRTDNALTAPFAKGVIEESPDASSARDTLEEDTSTRSVPTTRASVGDSVLPASRQPQSPSASRRPTPPPRHPQDSRAWARR